MSELQLFIDGRLQDATSNESYDNVNPATGVVISKVQVASKTDVDKAVAAAKKGFAVWSTMTGAQRGRILMNAVKLLRERNEELARLEVLDTGKPIQEAAAVDILSGADAIEYFAGIAPSLHGQHFDLGQSFAYTRREPLGVCVGIGAWNYPIQIACWKSGPALACGNAMIFKPAPLTPTTAVKLAEIYTEAGLPDGVFNVLHGHATVGEALTAHPGVAKVSLTGSVPTGKRVMAAAAQSLKKVTMELGGKSPLLIFADADLDNAVSAAILGNFYTQGEICSNGTRVFVQEAIVDAFLERLTARVKKMKIGNPMDPETHVGALISQDHMEKVLGYIEAGKKSGAKLVAGGKRVTDGDLVNGCFVEPTIFADCRDDMSICREEVFGPVMSVLSFKDEEEVIRRANDTEFGLAAGVFTKDIQRAHRVIARLEAGTCWINNYNITPIEMPFGGNKLSGIGRENSLAAVEHYTQLKSVYVEGGNVAAPY
ncbi:betaine-aldehyde dehydrogenase [Dongia soli]|uniref:Betaine-aldehyde dehydrogenase n=1 Tax=Dongia soli TaxID=600628 RepID=A0ABU5E9L7_9PROT|nr:betaine-aldehyde dehydrogenase [Dongia soli]MDY0882893.1 betaine-aldehyde dehydrogenase [Dongia soli]